MALQQPQTTTRRSVPETASSDLQRVKLLGTCIRFRSLATTTEWLYNMVTPSVWLHSFCAHRPPLIQCTVAMQRQQSAAAREQQKRPINRLLKATPPPPPLLGASVMSINRNNKLAIVEHYMDGYELTNKCTKEREREGLQTNQIAGNLIEWYGANGKSSKKCNTFFLLYFIVWFLQL